ncbi:hypothetical protein BSKO_02385 [Bryopsis sp. KO-2023]|nr:hypothetical protein BSKO_02385 [Bryopsis sp. KO-2023]
MEEERMPVLPLGMDLSSLRVVEKVMDVSIEPGNCTAVESAVDEQFKQMVLRHSEELDGVPLSFSDLKIHQNQEAMIHPYFPFLQVTASAKFSVFSPKKGMKLVGVVKRITNDMICLSVLDLFPAVVRRSAVTNKLQADIKVGQWVSAKDPSYIIGEGKSIVFTLESVNCRGGLFSIDGSLMNLKTEGLHEKVVKKISKGGDRQRRQIVEEKEPDMRPKKRKRKSKENKELQGGPSSTPIENPSPEENGAKPIQQTVEGNSTSIPKKRGKKKRNSGAGLDGKAQVNPTNDEKGKGEESQSNMGETQQTLPFKNSKDTPRKKRRKRSGKNSNSGLGDSKVQEENGVGGSVSNEVKKVESGDGGDGVGGGKTREEEGPKKESKKKKRKRKSSLVKE